MKIKLKKEKIMRQVDIAISGRKIQGYPTITETIEFDTVEDFMEKADLAIEDTDFGKVDCCVDNFDNVFNEDEVSLLEEDGFIVD
jgi:hypothetical protein